MVDNKGQPAARGIYTLAEGLRTKLFKKEKEEEERIIRR
jgi:hypothetical protein